MARRPRRPGRTMLARVRALGRGRAGTSEAVPRGRRRRLPATGRTARAEPDPYLAVLRRGGSLAEAAVTATRQLVDQGRADVASSVGASLLRDPGGRALGALALGLLAAGRGYDRLAWHYLRELPSHIWAALVAGDYVACGLRAEPEAALDALRSIAAEAPAGVPAQSWLDMAGLSFGYGDHDLAEQLLSVVRDRLAEQDVVPEPVASQLDWLGRWVVLRPLHASAPEAAAGAVSVAVMDYDHPGRHRASANIGDHVQSLASLGHLVRHQRVGYAGPTELVELAERLRGRVRPDRRSEDVTATVQLIQVDRDASMYAEIPPRTWALAFGWFMHPIFEMRYGFPFHRNLLPIFVSFHCSSRAMLTPEAVAYLRRFAPIGCRDWTTVDLLLSLDVPAFFSGCVTTTVDTLFPDLSGEPSTAPAVAYVDMPADDVPPGAPTHHHSDDAVRLRSFTANVDDAVELLETYRRYQGLVTSRLHCYLPARSLGIPVEFRPRSRSDPRFAGLVDIDDDQFAGIRDGLEEVLGGVMAAILAGRAPDEVYDVWRGLTSRRVAAARRRHDEERPLPVPAVDLHAELASLRDPVAVGDQAPPSHPVHVVVHAKAGRELALEVLLSSLARHASRPVHAWLLNRTPRSLDLRALASPTSGLLVTEVRTRGLGADLRRPDGSRASARDVDRLAVADLLAEVDRVLVLPVDAVVLADVAELVDIDLRGHLLAAPTVAGRRGASGFGVLNAAGTRLEDRTAAATELRRRAYARHRFDFDAFDTDLLVVDLARWRADRVLDRAVGCVEQFGLTFREALHLEVGPHRTAVPERWHVVPTRSVLVRPALVHWADGAKPWSDDLAVAQEVWWDALSAVPAGVGR